MKSLGSLWGGAAHKYAGEGGLEGIRDAFWAKPQEEDLNVKLRRLRDRQLRQGIYPDGTRPPPLLTRAGRRTRDVPPPSPPPPDECPICLENLDDASPALACDHRFHAACVQELVAKAWAEGAKRTRSRGTAVLCPLCRGQSYIK